MRVLLRGAITALFGMSFPIGCVGHILPYTPKVRSYAVDDYGSALTPLSPGSIYVEGPGWLSEPRASSMGDIITVKVEEGENGVHSATTKLSKNSTFDAGLSAFFGLTGALAKAIPGLDPSKLISTNTGSQHNGEGETTRTGQLNATVPVRIKRLLPNGDYYVEGSKVVLVNSEEHHIYLSGVVRPIDLLSDNSVSSTRIGDLQVELTGRGVITEKQNPGWASRVLDYVWPF